MIYTTLSGRLSWSLRKNLPDMRALAFGDYPDFVRRDVDDIGDVIPVFAFHSVEPRTFKECCLGLVEGGYRTLGADEFLAVLEGRRAPERRSVVLTFDDGGGSTWGVAYPLLEMHGLRGIAFVVSGLVSEDEGCGPCLKDVWSGECKLDEVLNRERSGTPMCTWSELARMQASGVIDIQSHSHTHALVHVGTRIRDFLNPETDPYLIGNFNIPVVRQGESDRVDRPLRLGRPVYEALPRLAGRRRYFDDENVRRECEAYVTERGGSAFFTRPRWRGELRRVAGNIRGSGDYESVQDMAAAILAELEHSRTVIEDRVGVGVAHLCFPWYEGSSTAVEAARRVGYRAAYWGVLRSPNAARAGSDAYRVPRLDARYVTRLPGPRRESLGEVLGAHLRAGFRRSAFGKQAVRPHPEE